MYRVVFAYTAMCLIWGTTWLGIKIGLHTLSPIPGVGLRFVIAGLFLYAVAAWRRELRPLREYPWRVIAVLATLLFGVNYVLTYTAETHLDSGLVSVLFGTLPFYTFAFGALMIGERSGPRAWIGAVLAFAGVAVISLTSEVRASIPFALCSLLAAAVAAFSNVYAKKHSHHAPLLTLPPAMLLSGIAVSLIGFAVAPTNWGAVFTPVSLGALLYLAILGSGIAFFLMMWLLQRIPAYAIGLASLIFPVIALTVGALFGGEHFGTRELLGSALVIVGLGFALTRPV
ncbi:MAG TPA: EamA family transporter [Candidatus Baltobacteraceae bacterium]|nr:EamA family transporter [Candidatus Baltobacteraceae bacterium]